MFVEGQGLIKKELVRRFPFEDFTWIDSIFPEEKEVKMSKRRNKVRRIPPTESL